MLPEWFWMVFVFAFGCCIGSFLNVVIYRLPQELSIVSPPSRCGTCGRRIRFYDNIPLFSWLILRARCRHCGAHISARYFVIELLTGLVFTALFYMYFYEQSRAGMPPFLSGGCFIYMLHLVLLASLIAASAIDLELWVIPLSICWFATAIGLIGASVGPCIINLHNIEQNFLLPLASAKTAALAAGGGVGLAFSLVLLKLGILKRSYEAGEPAPKGEPEKRPEEYNHRTEVLKEVVFLVPIILFACFWRALVVRSGGAALWWVDFSQHPVVAGLLGGLWAYFVGCGVVWATRIFGTLLFGKEAMGMGDVHLMGAAGAVLGPWPVVIAFFIAPFFGLLWAATQMFFKKVRQIPYGPFLSLGIFTVMIFHDRIVGYLAAMFYY